MKAENIKYKWLFFWYVMVCLSGFYEVQLHFNKRNLFQEYQTIVSETQRIEKERREHQQDYSARQVAQSAMEIASEICVYTNTCFTTEEIGLNHEE